MIRIPCLLHDEEIILCVRDIEGELAAAKSGTGQIMPLMLRHMMKVSLRLKSALKEHCSAGVYHQLATLLIQDCFAEIMDAKPVDGWTKKEIVFAKKAVEFMSFWLSTDLKNPTPKLPDDSAS